LELLVDTIPVGIGKAEEIFKIVDLSGLEPGAERESAQWVAMRTVLSEWNKVSLGVKLFNAEFAKLGDNESKYRDGISKTVMKIHEAIRDTDARAVLLGSQIGHDTSEASGQGDESIWDTI
jgi:hypothetical protein